MKISGDINYDSKIFVIGQSTDILEAVKNVTAGAYEVTGLDSGQKIIVSVPNSGTDLGQIHYGVTPLEEPRTTLSTSSSLKSPYITLSNGNLTATRIGTDGGAYINCRTYTSVTSGKWYWEIYINNRVDDCFVGIFNSSLATNLYPSTIDQGATWWSWPGWYPGTTAPAPIAWNSGDRIMIAMDLNAKKLWFGKNGVWLNSGNPVAGTGPCYGSPYTPALGTVAYGAGAVFRGNNAQFTFNFGATPFSYSVPAGFYSGLPG